MKSTGEDCQERRQGVTLTQKRDDPRGCVKDRYRTGICVYQTQITLARMAEDTVKLEYRGVPYRIVDGKCPRYLCNLARIREIRNLIMNDDR